MAPLYVARGSRSDLEKKRLLAHRDGSWDHLTEPPCSSMFMRKIARQVKASPRFLVHENAELRTYVIQARQSLS